MRALSSLQRTSLAELPDEVLLNLMSFLDQNGLVACGATCRELFNLVVHECFRLGVRWQRRRFLDEAVSFFSAVLRLDPRHAGALDERAIALFNMSNRPGAVADLLRSAALAKQESERLTYESVAMEMRGELQAALQTARKAIAIDPTNGRAHFEMAYVLQELPFRPDHKGAVAAYTKAYENGYHRQYVTIFNRAWALEALEDYAGAMADYRLTVAMNPYFSQAARCVVRLLEKSKDTEGLRAEVERLAAAWREAVAQGVPPAQCAHLLVQQAQARDSLGEDDLALELYQTAIDHGHPRPSSLYSSRAYLLEQHRHYAAAREAWDKAVECDSPVSSLILESRGKFKLRRADVEGAKEDFQQIATSKTGSPSHGNVLLALLAREENNLQEAFDQVERALSLHPPAELTDTRLLMAELCCRRGDYHKARHVYDEILAWYPREPHPLKLRANVFLRIGKPLRAEKDYLAALAEDAGDEDEVAALNVGCLQFWRGDYEGAARSFKRCLAKAPTDFKALCNHAHTSLKLDNYAQALADYRQMQQLYPGSVTQAMLVALETDPRAVEQQIGNRNMLFARSHQWEDWMSNPFSYCRRDRGPRQELPGSDGEYDDEA